MASSLVKQKILLGAKEFNFLFVRVTRKDAAAKR